MAKKKAKGSPGVNRAAEAVGHLLGSVAGTIESIREQHPDPGQEARDALTAGDEALAGALSMAKKRAAPMIKKAKAIARQAKKTLTTRRKSASPVARAKGAARKVVKGATKAARSTNKAVGRAARRLKR